jgi:hypothetical protein
MKVVLTVAANCKFPLSLCSYFEGLVKLYRLQMSCDVPGVDNASRIVHYDDSNGPYVKGVYTIGYLTNFMELSTS